MKVARSEKHVLSSSGLEQTKAFEIRASAHAFKILSSGLYSDKITAVLREIGCNAYDAHVMAGIAHRPFEVKLPNALDRQFYIRDHGPGLSHEEILNLYTTYFASTKQESNDFTGAFGLGSKSPFSYTDSFTVTSCHGGRKRTYTAHIDNKSGAPVVALMAESELDDDWKSGIEVGFPVKPGDFQEFQQKARKVFRSFATVPDVAGASPVKPFVMAEDFGSFAFLKEYEDRENVLALMGNVVYPVNKDRLGLKDDDAVEKVMSMHGLVLRTPIGSIEIAASREEIQYSPDTVKYLKKALKGVYDMVLKEVREKLNGVKTWADMCRFKEMENTVFRGIYVTSDMMKKAGVSDPAKLGILQSYSYPLPDVREPGTTYGVVHLDGGKLKVNRPWSATGRSGMPFEPDVTIVAGAVPKGLARARKAFAEGALKGRVLLVTPLHKDGAPNVDAVAQRLQQHFKGVPMVDLGTLPPPPENKVKIKRGRKVMPDLPDLPVEMDSGSVSMRLVPDDRKLYLPYKPHGGKYFFGDKVIEGYQLRLMFGHMEQLRKIGLKVPKPVLITRQAVIQARITRRPEWRPWRDALIEAVGSPEMVAELKKLMGEPVPIVSLNKDGATNLLACMVCLREHGRGVFKLAEPVLRKHGVLDQIVEIHENSKRKRYEDVVKPPQALTSLKDLADYLEVKVQLPTYSVLDAKLKGSFPKTAGVEYDEYCMVARLAPNSFATVLEELMTKED